MDEHKKFLADRLLSEEQPITYRLLSRALDVHVNTAKEMLYDFHTHQNAQKANSIHATYLIHGTKASQEDDDVEMASSAPDHEPLSETVPNFALTLVREENLTAVLSEYQAVDSIHIYSLGPSPHRDLSILSDLKKSLYEYSVKEDFGTAAEKYGVIGNPQLRKRDRASKSILAPAATKPLAKPTASAVKAEPAAIPAPSSASTLTKAKQEPAADKAPKKESTPSSSAGKAAPATKRGAAGGIMQSFAKAAAMPPKPKREPVKEEPAMSDDGEADDDDIPTVKTSPRAVEARRQAQKKRTEYLKRMMEEASDEDEDENEKKSEKDEDEEMEEAPELEEEPEPEPVSEVKKAEEEPSEIVSSTVDGKRRGKRRVMQKKRILDDEGFMVTVQEHGWESFSEDEAPPAKKPTPASTASSTSTPASSGAKAKKPPGKASQGNIMSFFSKK